MSKYLKPDSELGYIEDEAAINYLKFNNIRHSVLGCMMGDYDAEGNYVVSPEITKELIAMPKYITESLDNMEICLSELKLDKQLSFLVTFEEDRATLSLIEKLSYEANIKLNSGTYSNINEYVLDTVQTSGTINKNVIYRRWNINEFQGNVIDIFSCDESVLAKYFGIVNRFKYLLVTNRLLLEKEGELEEFEAEYANQVFDLIKRFPEFEKAILANLAVSFKEKENFLQPEKPNYVKTLNEMLDSAILQNQNILSEEQKQEFEAELRKIYLQIHFKRLGTIDLENANGIDTISVQQMLAASLHEIGAEFVKAVNGFKKDAANENEYKKLMEYLAKQKLIEIKKAEEKKVEELVKKAQEKAAEQAKAKAASNSKAKSSSSSSKSASKKSSAKAKSGAKDTTNTKKEDDAKKKAEEEARIKAEQERKRKEEEEMQNAARRRKRESVKGLISAMTGESINLDGGRIVFSATADVSATATEDVVKAKETAQPNAIEKPVVATAGADSELSI